MRKKLTQSILLGISLLFFGLTSQAQITSAASGNWSSTSTWTGGVVPTSADNVVIAAGHTVAVDDATAVCNNLSFGDATAKLNMNTATSVLSIYGNFTQAGDLHVVFTGWVPGAKVKFTGPAATQTISGSTGISSATYIPPSFSFNELQIDKPVGTTVLTPDGATNTAGNVLAIANSLEIISGRLLIGTRSDLEGKDLTNAASPAAYIATKPSITVQAAGTFEMNGVNAHIRSGQFSVATPADGDNAKIGLMTVYGSAIMRPNQAQGISFLGITVEAGATMDIKSGNNANFNPGSVLVKTNGTFIYSSTGASTVWYNNTVTPTTVLFETGSTYEFGSVQSQASTYVPPAPGLTLTHPMYVRYANATTGLTPDSRFASYSNLVLIGTAKAFTQNVTVSDTLFMRTTATSAPSITLSGFTLTYGANATLQYRGIGTPPVTQTTTDIEWPTSGSIPKNVSIYNSRAVTLNNTKSITGQLSFMNDSSLLKIGNNSITVNSTTGQGRLRFVPITGTGTLTIRQVGNTPVTFPVGISDNLVTSPNAYKPVTITNNGTADDFTVKVAAGSPCAVPAAESVNAVWNITEATPGSSSSNLQFQWYSTDENAGFTRTACQGVGCDNTNTVTSNGASGAAAGTDPYTKTMTGVSTFFNFGVKNSNLDMSATALVAPTDGGCKTAAETVTVTIKNNAASAIDFTVNNVTVNVTATGGYSSSVVVNTGTLAGGATQNVTMPATADLSAGGAFVFNASTMVSGDVNTGNDAMTPVTINATTGPNATISYAGSPYCTSVATAQTVTLTGTTGGTYSSTAGLSIDGTTGEITPSTSTPGTYTVTYSIAAAGGCAAFSTTASVTITAAPSATISYAGTPFCTSVTTAQAVTLTGTTGGTYSSTAGLSIDGNTGEITPSTSTPGTYTVTYSIAAAGGCALFSTTASVTITAAPSATISYAGTPFCTSVTTAQPVTLTGTSGGTYSSTAGLSINTSNGEITPSTSTPGTYTVTYTIAAAGGCALFSTTASVTITAAPSATISYAGTPFCTSVTTAQPVTLTGTSGGTYSSTAGLSINTSNGEITPSTSTPGTYTVTYTIAAAGGCALFSTTASVTVTAAPSATISYAGTPFCATNTTPQAVTLTGTTGGTYSSTAGLSIDGTTGDITPSTSTPGTYTVTYTIAAAGGCAVFSTTTTVSVVTAPSAVFSYAGTPYCSNASNPLPTYGPGAGAGTFSATPSGLVFVSTSTGQVNLAASTPGTYTVTNDIAAGNGCPAASSTSSITITAAPAATISYAGTPFCTSVATAQPVTQTGSGGGSYSSTAGLSIDGTTGEITPSTSTPGTYTVTYTIAAAGGCAAFSTTASVTITAAPSATISYAGSPYCTSVTTAQPVTLTGTTGGSYSSTAGLSIDGTTGEITPSTSTPGTYTVTYTIAAAGGCALFSTTASVTITAAPSATISYAGPFCVVNTTPQAVTLTGTTGGSFSATPSGLSIDPSTGAITPSASTVGVYTVTYTIAAAGGCAVFSTTANVSIVNAPSASFSYTATPYCSNAVNPLPTLGAGAVAGVFSAAPSGLVFVSTATGEVNIAASTPGTYTVTNSLAASGGCPAVSATSSITITMAPSAAISYAGSPYCTSVTTSQPVTQTGTGGGTYSSTAGLSINATTGAIIPSTSTPGTYTVTYTVAAAGGCAAYSTTAGVTITAAPSATISYAGSPFCATVTTPQAVTLTGTTGGTFSAAAGLSINTTTGAITPSASTPGTYTVTYTVAASGGCAAFSAITLVTVTALPAAAISYAGTPYCATVTTAQPVTLTGTTGGTYSSTAGLSINPSTGAITPSASTPGTYTVTYTMAAANGCPSVSVTTPVTITAVPTATISYAGAPFCSSLATAQSVTLTGATGGSYSASPAGLTINASTGAITPSTSTPGTYTVTYTIPAQSGCAAVPVTTSVTVTAAPTATISYAGAPFCTSGGTISVTRTGSTGGTYSAPAGLTISSSTGAITVGTSTPGTYTVTYTVAAAGGCAAFSTTTSVTVNAVSIAPTGVTLSKTTSCGATTVNLAVAGGTLAPGASWKWYKDGCGGTSFATGATVNNVVVSATTTFYVRAEGGVCGNSTCASATITVFTVPTITINYQTDSLVWPLQTKTIVATATPAASGNIFEWYKNGAIVPGVTGSTITVDVDNVGLYTAKVTTPDGCAATTATGRLISAAYKENLWIYPNPTSGKFTVRYFNDRPVNVSRYLVITGMSPRKVYEAKFILNGPYAAMNVDLSNYPKGMYIVTVRRSDGAELISGKIVLQ